MFLRQISTDSCQEIRQPDLGKFNLPNRVTYARYLLTTVIFVIGYWNLYAFIMFPLLVIAGMSDGIDGKLARDRKEKTRFGAINDRVADKYLVFIVSALIWFSFQIAYTSSPRTLMQIAIIELKCLVGIETTLSIAALLGGWKGWPVESNGGGKIKMTTQIVLACWWSLFLYILIPATAMTLNSDVFLWPMVVLLTISNIFAIISSWGYMKTYAPLIRNFLIGK